MVGLKYHARLMGNDWEFRRKIVKLQCKKVEWTTNLEWVLLSLGVKSTLNQVILNHDCREEWN